MQYIATLKVWFYPTASDIDFNITTTLYPPASFLHLLKVKEQESNKENKRVKTCLDPPWGINSLTASASPLPKPTSWTLRSSEKPQQIQLPMSPIHCQPESLSPGGMVDLRAEGSFVTVPHAAPVCRQVSKQWLKINASCSLQPELNGTAAHGLLHRTFLDTDVPTGLPQVATKKRYCLCTPSVTPCAKKELWS